MKKGIVVTLSLIFMITPLAYAQTARNASEATITHSRTNYTNVGATGMDVDGNPGYIVMTGVNVAGGAYRPEWYLWVDSDNDLCMASHSTIVNYASFPDGAWRGSMGCSKVGSQS